MENLPSQAYAAIFEQNDVGKKIFEELCMVFYDIESFDIESTHQTAFNEGKRAVMRHIMLKIMEGQGNIK